MIIIYYLPAVSQYIWFNIYLIDDFHILQRGIIPINHYKSTILVEYSLYFLIHNASLPIILTIFNNLLTMVIYIYTLYLRDLSHVSGECPLGICLVRSRLSNGMNHPGRPGCLLKSGQRKWQLIWDFMAKMIWIWDFIWDFHEDMGDDGKKKHDNHMGFLGMSSNFMAMYGDLMRIWWEFKGSMGIYGNMWICLSWGYVGIFFASSAYGMDLDYICIVRYYLPSGKRLRN